MKKNYGRIITAALMVLTLSVFTGCGSFWSLDFLSKVPTAEELLDQSYEVTQDTYLDADMKMDIKALMDMSGLMGESSGSSATMEMAICLDANIVSDNTTQHMKGDMDVNVFGMNMQIPVETYTAIHDDTATVFDYSADYEIWTMDETSIEDSSFIDLMSIIKGLPAEMFESYELKELEDKDADYIITGVIDMASLMNLLGSDTESLLGTTELTTDAFDVSKLVMNATIVFDKETLMPVSYAFYIDPESVTVEDAGVEKFDIEIVINDVNETGKVIIPDDVIDAAIGNSIDYESESEPDIIIETGDGVVLVEPESEDVNPEIVLDQDVDGIDNWTTYEFNVNGTTMLLPCTYAEFKNATGWAMKPADEKSYLEGGYYTSVNLYNEAEDLMCYISIANPTDGDLCYADATVMKINQSSYNVEQGSHVITFPYNLKVGMEITPDMLKTLIGEPSDTYEYLDNPDYQSYTYTWNEHERYINDSFEVNIVNNVIEEIELSAESYAFQ